MFNEPVKNLLMGGQIAGQAKAGQAVGGGKAAAGQSSVFTDAVRRIMENEFAVAVLNETPAPATPAASGYHYDESAGIGDDELLQANNIMVDALIKIAELLGLPEGSAFERGHILDFDAESMDRFADILWSVEKAFKLVEKVDLAGFIENKSPADMGIDMYPFSRMNNPGELAEFTSELRMAKSHLELGFYMLDLQDLIAEKIAGKYGTSASVGITQAANPSDLGMSVSDLARVFGSLIREEMVSALERVGKITSGQVEMTALEKAAVEMGTLDSEILKISLGKIKEFDFENANLKIGVNKNDKDADNGASNGASNGKHKDADTAIDKNAGVDMNKRVSAAVNHKTPVEDADLPLSVKDIESANVKASRSIETMSWKIVTADRGSDIPVSVSEAMSKQRSAEENPAVNKNRFDNILNTVTSAYAAMSEEEKAALIKPEQRARLEAWVKTELAGADRRNGAQAAGVSGAIEESVKSDNGVNVVNIGNSKDNNDSNDNNVDVTAKAGNANKNVGTNVNAGVINNAGTNVNVNNNTNVDTSADTKAGVSAKVHNAVANANVGVDNNENININANAGENARESAKAKIGVNTGDNVNNKTKADVGVNTNANANTSLDANADVKANIDAGSFVNANIKPNTNSAGQSTESGVGIAFADSEGVNESLETPAETDTQEQVDGVSKADAAEAKAAQFTDKVDKAASAFSRIDNEALIRQLTERMHHAIRNGAHEVRMILRPESLGEVRMSIRVHGDVVIAKMQVENRQVKAIVESNMQSLKDDLAKQNLNLDSFTVDVGVGSDKSPNQTWREMAEASGNSSARGEKGFKDDGVDDDNDDPVTGTPLGSDTGRRFGNNSFEYFI